MTRKNDKPSELSDEELAKLAGYEGDQLDEAGLPLETTGRDVDEDD